MVHRPRFLHRHDGKKSSESCFFLIDKPAYIGSMSFNSQYLASIVSALSVLPVLIVGVVYFNSLPTLLKRALFLFWLGLFTDLFGWYCYLTNNASANIIAFNCYMILEYSFYAWFVGQVLYDHKRSILLRRAWIVLIPLWFLTIRMDENHRFFSLTIQILLSLLLSFCILRHVENEREPYGKAVFWILLGSFFYYFCTFFFMGFLNVKFILKIWHIKNIVGITSNAIFFYGFWIETRKQARKMT